MEDYLRKDPIIESYFNFRNANESRLPVFSETVLRLAVKEVLSFKYQKQEDVLSMYRKLIVILYSETYKSMDDMEQIMTCFNRNEIMQCIENIEEIQDSWKLFTVEEMIYYIRKNAFFTIMSEWSRRFTHFYGENLMKERLGQQIVNLHDFFNWPVKSAHQWKRSFETNFIKRNPKEINDYDLANMEVSDVSIKKIVADLKNQLHPLINADMLTHFIISIKSLDNDAANKFKPSKSIKFDYETTRQEKNLNKQNNEDNESRMINNAEIVYTSNIEGNTEADNNADDADIEFVHIVEISDNESNESLENQSPHKKRKTELESSIDQNSSEEYEEEKYTIPTAPEGAKKMYDNIDELYPPLTETDQSGATEIINDEKASQFLSALQAYAVVNELYEAIGLLDRVDSIMRTKFIMKN